MESTLQIIKLSCYTVYPCQECQVLADSSMLETIGILNDRLHAKLLLLGMDQACVCNSGC